MYTHMMFFPLFIKFGGPQKGGIRTNPRNILPMIPWIRPVELVVILSQKQHLAGISMTTDPASSQEVYGFCFCLQKTSLILGKTPARNEWVGVSLQILAILNHPIHAEGGVGFVIAFPLGGFNNQIYSPFLN